MKPGRTVWVSVIAAVLSSGTIPRPTDDPLHGLPVHRYDPDSTPVGGIVFFSGDGGWRSFDKTNADSLRLMGYRLVGVDDLRLFAVEMPGDSLAALARRLVAYLRDLIPSGAPVYLAGYSFGASIVADAAARDVPADGLYLLGPGRRGIRKITVAGFLNHDPTGPTSFDVVDRLNARGSLPVAFVTGDDDKAGKGAVLFPLVHQPAQQFLVAGAGHHYYGADVRYMRAAREALAWLKRHRGP